MDAFIVRKRRADDAQLFDRDAFLFVPPAASETKVESSDEAAAKAELTALVATNGGRVLDVESDLSESRTLVALLLTSELRAADTEMLARVLRSHPSTVVVRAQWVRDCTAQQTRLALHAYEQTRAARALVLHGDAASVETASTESEADSNKRRRVAVDATAVASALAVLPTPHLTPWREVDGGSLFLLDARSSQQQEAAADASTPTKTRKIAGFDMDGTLITTKSGKRFAKDANDWTWLHPTRVRLKLQALVREGFDLVVFSNQNGIATGQVTAREIQTKVEAIVRSLNLPVLVLLATKSDRMRKPRFGGWHEMLRVLSRDDTSDAQVDMDASFYCGDAAGRPKIAGRAKDFAATDYKFALNLGLPFHTPEALFLGSTQRIHTHSDLWEIGFDPRPLASANAAAAAWLAPPTAELAKTTQEMVVLVGPPASGKSFFAATHFPSYTIVNQDELRTLANCKKLCVDALAQQQKSVVIDSTNRDTRSRSEWVALAREQNVPVRCFEMDVEKALSMHLNTFRSLTKAKKIPDIAIHTFYKNFVPPQAREGFAEIVKVRFQVNHTQLSQDKRELLCSFL